MRVNNVLKLGLLALVLGACAKPAGPGGRATVTGKVYAYDWDNTQNYMISQGYSSGEKVYIIYGDGSSIGNNVTTSVDGSFEFRYLNKGHYKVFVNSLDTSRKIKGNDTERPVIKEFDINSATETVTLEDFVINK
jgi:hypothetical protein